MRGALYILGGLLIWAVHFAGVYAIVSIAAQTRAADTAVWQAVSLAFSIACVLGTGTLLVLAGRRSRRQGYTLIDHMAALGALFAVVAIVWQAAAPLYGG